ncbi:hypothetical protein [Nocardioides sp.]|jgi:hypothetical protein|uniref:hypothetical protein n=1 Tax=Nocardioides sp. TaxID=35761 RepID=UPI002F42B704
MNKSRLITVGSAAAVLALTAGAASAASSMITSKDIRDGAVHRADLSKGVVRDLDKAQGLNGPIYRIAHYDGGASGTAVATVACADNDEKSQKYIAIAGGTQIINADGDTNFSNDATIAVSDSFPGRMDWTTQTPKPNRLDGWVVRWDDAAKSTPKVNVWAVCVKRSDNVKVQTTNY